MKYSVGNYTVEKDNGRLQIDYSRSLKDYFYILAYFLLSAPFLYIGYKMSEALLKEEIDTNSVIGIIFSVALILVGCYFLLVSVETFLKPTSEVFLIESSQKQLRVKLNRFRAITIPLAHIHLFELGARDITVTSHNRGRAYKRQLYLLELYVVNTDKKARKIHQFERPNLMISFSEKKKNKSLKETSRQITDLIAKECGTIYQWKGIKKED